MELIDRYVYAVVRHLPEKQRDEIDKEIRALISDLSEKYSDELSEQKRIEKVLSELGDPVRLADHYRGHDRYLIGPQYFTRFILVLKIVLIAVFIAISIGMLVSGITGEYDNVSLLLGDYVSSIFNGLFQAFAIVVFVFAVMEYKHVDISHGEKWEPKKLQPVPHKKARISRANPLVGVFFTTIFAIILYFFPQIFAIYSSNGQDGYTIIPLFNIDAWLQFKWLIVGYFMISILREVVKMIYGRWCIEVSILYSLLTLVSMVIFIVLFVNPTIYNPNFITDVATQYNITIESVWNKDKIIHTVIQFIVGINILEIILVMIRGIRFNNLRG